MILCSQCGVPTPAQGPCTSCGTTIKVVNGINCFAPDLIESAGGFRQEYFADLFQLEAGNFWFRARNQLILGILERHCGKFSTLLEIGCGTGYVLSGIKRRFPNVSVVGSEIFLAGLEFAAERIPSATLQQMDARHIPYQQEFDVIGAFDVIEHIKEDTVVMEQVRTALNPGGYFLLTVPQHRWLWSSVDEYAQHERRYSRKELHSKLEAAGFRLVRSSSFVTSLLPVMLVSRLIARRELSEEFDPLAEFNIPVPLNNFLHWVLGVEVKLVTLGLSLPVGGSRLVLAQKV